MAGMQKGSGTRSGLLWEVERILQETENLPQVLIMENVPAVCGKKNEKSFRAFCDSLEKMGYTNHYKILNATGFKIPQNRKRCFMVSILGNYSYKFPEERELELRLKDMLEKNVPEKYYLSDKTVEQFIANTEKQKELGNGFRFSPTDGGVMERLSAQKPEDEWTTTLSGGFPDNSQSVNVEREREGNLHRLALKRQASEGNRGREDVTFERSKIRPHRKRLRNERDSQCIVYDDYNGRIRADQNTVGTITTNIGNDAPRNGQKIIEINGHPATDGDGITLFESAEWGGGENSLATLGDASCKQDQSSGVRADGITLGQSNTDEYRRGGLKDLSRTLRAGSQGGVIEWVNLKK